MFGIAGRRDAIAAGAAALILAIAGCGDGDDASSDSTAVTTSAPTTAPSTALPASTSAAPTTAAPATTAPATTASPSTGAPVTTSNVPTSTEGRAPTTTPAHDGPVIELTVGGEVSRHTVSVGDNVLLVVSGDATDEVHVHGYDLTAELSPDQAATITFVADIPGVFEIELEGAHQLLAELEVR
jgi:hypothetical protein